MLSQMHYLLYQWTPLCPAVGLLQTQLELAAISSRRTPLQLPHYQNLATYTQYKFEHEFQNTGLVFFIYRTKMSYLLIIKQKYKGLSARLKGKRRITMNGKLTLVSGEMTLLLFML